MSSVTLSRASGLALLLGAVLAIIGLPLSFVFLYLTTLWWVVVGVWSGGAVLLLLGLPGIVARQASRAGWLGFIGFLLMGSGELLLTSYVVVLDLAISPWLSVHAPLVGYQLSITNPAVTMYVALASSLFVVGGVLLGVATTRARVFPQWAGLLLIAGVVVYGVSLVISTSLVSIFSSVAFLLFLLGLGWMGYALVTAQGEAVPHPVPAS